MMMPASRKRFSLREKFLLPKIPDATQENDQDASAGHDDAKDSAFLRVEVFQDEQLRNHYAKGDESYRSPEPAQECPFESEVVTRVSSWWAVLKIQADVVGPPSL